MRSLLLLSAAAVAFLAAPAQAQLVDFNMPDAFSNPYSQDGFTVTNEYSPGVSTGTNGLGNWIAFGDPGYNANGDNPTIFANFSNTITTIAPTAGGSFNLAGLSFGDIYNTAFGGDISLTFNYFGGGSSTQTVSLQPVSGLQAFTFNQSNLSSFSFVPETTQGGWVQFDLLNLGSSVAPGVPEPATWAMMLIGFGAVGAAMRRQRKHDASGALALA